MQNLAPHLDRQFIDWFRCTVPKDLRAAFDRHPAGVEFEDRFFDSPEHALIHTETRKLYKEGEFRLGQSSKDEFIFVPASGKVVMRSMQNAADVTAVFANVPDFLIWMLELDESGIERTEAPINKSH